MNLHSDNSSRPEGPIVIEELKQLVQERRFVMKSYMQALGLYLALAGYGLNQLIAETRHKDGVQSPIIVTAAVAALFTALNVVAIYVAGRFKSMAIHARDREQELADKLGFKGPHSMIWGYGCGVVVVILYEIVVILVFTIRMRAG